MAEYITPLIMCGGAGTRLWPASREDRPKQFLRLLGPRSTFQETVLRVSDPALFGRPVIITNRQYRFLVAEQLREIGVAADILLEPHRRDSGPAIVAGTVFARQRDGDDPVMIVLAADHAVADPLAFAAACRAAKPAADDGWIVTFGIRPDRAATDYGYIRPGETLLGETRRIDSFVEKPNAERAASYMAEGYLWNSGNFLFRASIFLDEYRAVEAPSVNAVTAAIDTATTDLGFIVLDANSFAQAKATSVDYAVMEKTKRAAVLPVSYGWSDVGSWETIWRLAAKDAADNAISGKATALDSRGCYVFSEKSQVALLGVDDLVVIATDDAILVTRRDSVDGMKQLVDHLRQVAPQVIKDHLRVHRPWGSYRSLDDGSRYQVKRIVVKPHGRLSLQMHHHRAEHWIVVRGTALVTVGDQTRVIHENESTYIPIGAKHRLENPGKIDLELIEVQSGSYLGEDDIVRFDDDYRRSESEV
jgi:mannose-1-phosphate guanylyltransferase / mannose-6-phosphate isomerase